jgi:hypothetical protein
LELLPVQISQLNIVQWFSVLEHFLDIVAFAPLAQVAMLLLEGL